MRHKGRTIHLRQALLLSFLAHGLVFGAFLVLGQLKFKLAKPERVMITKLVRFAPESTKKLLPTKQEPVQSSHEEKNTAKKSEPAPEKSAAIPITEKKKITEKPQVTKEEKKKSKASEKESEGEDFMGALARLKKKAKLRGDPSGSKEGTSDDLTESLLGSKLATELYYCLKENFSIEGAGAERMEGKEAKIWVRIANDGRLLETQLEQGSGSPFFDSAVIKAAKGCKQISAPPKLFQKRALKDGFVVTFAP